MGEKLSLEMYTLKEVCEMLRISRRTIYNLLKDGKLKGVKVGREWRFSREQIEEFLRNGQ